MECDDSPPLATSEASELTTEPTTEATTAFMGPAVAFFENEATTEATTEATRYYMYLDICTLVHVYRINTRFSTSS